jgi:hypothetical protein
MFEPGGILPETNERQIWLGKEAPLFVLEVEEPKNPLQSVEVTVVRSSDFLKLDFWSGILVLEGQVGAADPRDLKELTFGGRPAIRPRRLYTQVNSRTGGEPPNVQVSFQLALGKGWITIPDYDHHKTVLPQLSVD